jgi:hypothetical protein
MGLIMACEHSDYSESVWALLRKRGDSLLEIPPSQCCYLPILTLGFFPENSDGPTYHLTTEKINTDKDGSHIESENYISFPAEALNEAARKIVPGACAQVICDGSRYHFYRRTYEDPASNEGGEPIITPHLRVSITLRLSADLNGFSITFDTQEKGVVDWEKYAEIIYPLKES